MTLDVALLYSLSPWHLLSFAALALGFLSHPIRRLQGYQGQKTHGCKPVPRYPQWDPIFGLDVVFSQSKALKEHWFLPWLRKMHEGMPKTFSVNFFGRRYVYTIEPENLKALTAVVWKDFGIAPIRRHSKASMPFADKGVNTVDGEDWVFSRFLIKPFFMREVYTSTDRIAPHADKFFQTLPADGEEFNVQPYLQRWFLDTTTSFIFGEPMDALTHPERADITWSMLGVLRGGRLRIHLSKFLWLFSWRDWLTDIGKVHAYLNDHIRRTYREIEEYEKKEKTGGNAGPEPETLIWYMAKNLRDEELLRSQMALIFVPNNDTTSIFISNCIWHLARNPRAWEKCREEVLALGQTPLTFEVCRQLKYVNAVINETHRLNPNNVTQVRQALKNTTLPVGGGPDGSSPVFIQEGDVVQVTKTVLHRDQDLWGPDADSFIPERWDGLKPYWSFVPFGGGPRRCPAQMMVQTESAYMLARFAQVYRWIEARDPEPFTAVMRIGPSNKTGVKIALYK